MAAIDWRIERFDALISTQDTIKDMAGAGAAQGTVVQADSQSGGHGRHGRVWESPQGNLYLSMLLRPNCPSFVIGQLSLLTGVVLARVIKSFGVKGVMLKWPNDVLLSEQKCAGLLLESSLSAKGDVEWVAIGVGVNVGNAPIEGGGYLGDDVDLCAFEARFLTAFSDMYETWQDMGFAGVREEWLLCAHRQGQALSVKMPERLETGFFHDIDSTGNLRLRQDDGGLKTITSGDVYVTGD